MLKSDGAPDHTAFAQRDDHYALDILPMWSAHADTERCTAWAREFAAAVQPFSAGPMSITWAMKARPRALSLRLELRAPRRF